MQCAPDSQNRGRDTLQTSRRIIFASHFQDDSSSTGRLSGCDGTGKGNSMRLRFIPIWASLTLLAAAVGTSAQSAPTVSHRGSKDQPPLRQVSIAIDPRSTGEAQSLLIVKGFGNSCPNVSIVRDESEAEYVVFAGESDPWRGLLLHYYITVYDRQGKMVFATDKHTGKNASEAACRFINTQK